jgi:hypothetical protein
MVGVIVILAKMTDRTPEVAEGSLAIVGASPPIKERSIGMVWDTGHTIAGIFVTNAMVVVPDSCVRLD